MIRRVFGIIAVVCFGLLAISYPHAHSADFKVQCAFYQHGAGDMGFPDSLLCLIYYHT